MTQTWGEERAALRAQVRELTGHRTSGVRHCPSCTGELTQTHADLDEGLRSTQWWCTSCGYRDRGARPTMSAGECLALLHPKPVVEHAIEYDPTPWPEEEL